MGRLSHGLEPRGNRTAARPPWRLKSVQLVLSVASIEVREEELGLAPVLAPDPQGDVAAAEAIDGPVGGEDGLDPGLFQGLVPSASGAHVAKVAHDLPRVELRIVEVNRGLSRTGLAASAGESKAIEQAHP